MRADASKYCGDGVLPTLIYAVSILVFTTGYFLNFPTSLLTFTPPLMAGLIISFAFSGFVSLFTIPFIIVCFLQIVIRRKAVYIFEIFGRGYLFSCILLLFSTPVLAFGCGLVLGKNNSHFIKEFIAIIIFGVIGFIALSGLLMLFIEAVGIRSKCPFICFSKNGLERTETNKWSIWGG